MPAPLLRKLIFVILLMMSIAGHAKLVVMIDGIHHPDALKNVQARMGLLQLDPEAKTPRRHIRSLYLSGEDEIKEALRPFGYYHAQVESEMNRVDKDWEIIYRVTLGKPIIIRSISHVINGEGRDQAIFTQLENSLGVSVGQTFNQPAYDAYKRRLLNTADQHGYFDARFTTQQILIDPKNNTADISLVFDTGKAYYYGPIHFQSEYFDERFLRRFLIFKEGEPYNENQIAQLQANLLNSGFFTTGMVEAQRDKTQNDEVPIEVEVTPRKRFTYTAGAGYGTDTGARANLGFQWRRITKTGHSLNLNLNPAQYLQTYSLGYRIPAQQPATDYYEVYTAYISEQPEGRVLDSTTKQLGGLWSIGQPVNDLQQIYSITYQQDNYIDQEGSTTSRLVLPRASWEWIDAKDRFNADLGYRARLDVRGTSDAIGSTTEFAQFELNAKAIYPITSTTRLITRGQLGATAASTLEQIPPSLRFYAGGDNSVRGFMFEGLGVTVINDDGKKQNIGGSYLVVGSVEFDQVIWGDLLGAVFYDTGNAMNRITEPLAQAVGLGIRYKTPIGAIRIDLATPISESTDQVRLHLTVGPDL